MLLFLHCVEVVGIFKCRGLGAAVGVTTPMGGVYGAYGWHQVVVHIPSDDGRRDVCLFPMAAFGRHGCA